MTPATAPMSRVSEQERAAMPRPQRRYTVTVTGQHPNGFCEGIVSYEGIVANWSAHLPGYDRCRDRYATPTEAPVHNVWVSADKDRVLVAALVVHYFTDLHDEQYAIRKAAKRAADPVASVGGGT